VVTAETEQLIRGKYDSLAPAFNEAALRLWAGAEARSLGHGGVSMVARATGLSRNTVMAGVRELDDSTHGDRLASGRVRRPGGGRKRATAVQPGLGEALDRLVSPVTRGDPMSPLRWTSKSTEKLATELSTQGFTVGADTVATLLKAEGYSLQGTRKIKEGGDHPDRDAQFRHIAAEVTRMQAAEQPVISVDCKKKGNRSGPESNGEALGGYERGRREAA
jgi:hypothetical protein